MNHKRKNSPFRIILIIIALAFCLPLAFEMYAIWSMNAPSHINVVFPYGTQIIRETDTHRGFFRRKGTAITVAQIPQDSVQAFGNRLMEENFWEGSPYSEPHKKLEIIPEAMPVLKSENILWTYRDEAVAFIEEPYSDYFAAVYDLKTGLLCCIEYDE